MDSTFTFTLEYSFDSDTNNKTYELSFGEIPNNVLNSKEFLITNSILNNLTISSVSNTGDFYRFKFEDENVSHTEVTGISKEIGYTFEEGISYYKSVLGKITLSNTGIYIGEGQSNGSLYVDVTGTDTYDSESHTIEESVELYDLVYLDGTEWKTATSSQVPSGIYIKENDIRNKGEYTLNGNLPVTIYIRESESKDYYSRLVFNGDLYDIELKISATIYDFYTELLSWFPSDLKYGQVIIDNIKEKIINIYNRKDLDMQIKLTAPDGFWFRNPVNDALIKELVIVFGERVGLLILSSEEYAELSNGNKLGIVT